MLYIDHVIIASENPEQAAHAFAEAHGIRTVQGGRHENWGTFNHLAYFANNSYIEWIGIFDKKKAIAAENPLIHEVVQTLEDGNENMIQFALRTDAMNLYVNQFSERGTAYTGPLAGSRRLPSGSVLEWRMLFPLVSAPAPFLIEWGGQLNKPENSFDVNSGHIQSVTIGTNDDKRLAAFADTYGLSFTEGQARVGNGYLLSGEALQFQLG